MKATMSIFIACLLLAGCAIYSTKGPAARADQIYEDAYVCGRIVALKWPDLAVKTRLAAVGLLSISDPSDMGKSATQMLSWFDMTKAEDVALWWAGQRLIRYLGVKVLDGGDLDLGDVALEDIQMALKGYLAGLG